MLKYITQRWNKHILLSFFARVLVQLLGSYLCLLHIDCLLPKIYQLKHPCILLCFIIYNDMYVVCNFWLNVIHTHTSGKGFKDHMTSSHWLVHILRKLKC